MAVYQVLTINTDMKHITITALFVLFSFTVSADHVDNSKCIDELKHWKSLTEAQQNDSAAKALRDQGSAAWVQGDKALCESKYKQAITEATN